MKEFCLEDYLIQIMLFSRDMLELRSQTFEFKSSLINFFYVHFVVSKVGDGVEDLDLLPELDAVSFKNIFLLVQFLL